MNKCTEQINIAVPRPWASSSEYHTHTRIEKISPSCPLKFVLTTNSKSSNNYQTLLPFQSLCSNLQSHNQDKLQGMSASIVCPANKYLFAGWYLLFLVRTLFTPKASIVSPVFISFVLSCQSQVLLVRYLRFCVVIQHLTQLTVQRRKGQSTPLQPDGIHRIARAWQELSCTRQETAQWQEADRMPSGRPPFLSLLSGYL